jgi:hypothetical protein
MPAILNGVQSSNGYAPQSISVPRNPATSSGVAQFGTFNTLVVSFPNGTAQTYSVTIDPTQLQINVDLQLYIFFNVVVVVTPSGSAGQSAQLPQTTQIQGMALSKELAQSLLKKN